METRKDLRRQRLDALIGGFDQYVLAYDRQVPFTKTGQFENHVETLRIRRLAGSVETAIADDRFMESLWLTLRAWGIGVRASHMLDLPEFATEIRGHADTLVELDNTHLALSTSDQAQDVANLVSSLAVVSNKAKLVATTKTLHHLLPDLVVPIDRRYTGAFFGWHVPEFQSSQQLIFETAWEAFVEIARATEPERLVGPGWRTSTTKVIDNAIVGYCLVEGLGGPRDSKNSPATGRQPSKPRRLSWTVETLEEDLAQFEKDLQSAGLKPNSVDTYVGRADTFIRWLAGRYKPRGPNA